MPKLDDIMEKRTTKKFVKRNYRPWDLTGDTKQAEMADKQESSVDKSSDLLEHKANSKKNIKEQIRDNNETIMEHNGDNKKTLKEHPKNNQITVKEQSRNTRTTDKAQLENALGNAIKINSLKRVSGIQKRILEFFSCLCSINNSLDTGEIETVTLAEYAETTLQSIHTSLKRLIKKGLVTRLPGKSAKGGFIHFAINEDVKEYFTNFITNPDKAKSSIDFVNLVREQMRNAKPTYSSNSNINTTTKLNPLDENWGSINIEPLKPIGFSSTQLKQLSKLEHCDRDVVQESIYHFAFGLENNPKFEKYTDPLNVLMGVLRKGLPWEEPKYESPRLIAQRKLIEQKKLEREKIKQLEQEAFELAFSEWKDALSEEQINDYAPPKIKGDMSNITPQSVRLVNYFKKYEWDNCKRKYLID